MNNQNLNKFIIFVAGAAVGSLTTWALTKRHFERIADEEIESVKETLGYRRMDDIREDEACDEGDSEANDVGPIETRSHVGEKPNIMDYASKIQNAGYVNYANANRPKTEAEPEPEEANTEEKEVDDTDRPYIIKPTDFDEIGYDVISLTYYADGILAGGDNLPIDDVEEYVPRDFADHFGEYEDDSVFVRNDILEIDFEILKDPRDYDKVFRAGPCRSDDE